MVTNSSPEASSAQYYTPVWWDEAMLNYARGSLSKLATTVAIIGGGLAGILTAVYLARLGWKDVTLFEKRRQLCGGASGRNGGHINPGTLDFAASATRFGREAAKSLWLFEECGMRELTRLAKELRIDCEIRESGHVSLAADEEELERMTALQRLLSDPELGIPAVEMWDAGQCTSATGVGSFVGGLYRPRSKQLNPVKLCLGLADEAVRLGVDIRVDTVVHQVEEQEGGFKVVTDEGVLTSQYVVYATSAEGIGTFVPELRGKIQGIQGQVIATEPIEEVCRVGCGTFNGAMYWTQNQEGRIVLGGARSFAPNDGIGVLDDNSVNSGVGRALRRFLQDELGLAGARITHEWTGIMGTSLDGFPLVGELFLKPKQYVNTAFAGHGLPLIPGASRALAQRIVGAEERPSLPWLFTPRLERFTRSV